MPKFLSQKEVDQYYNEGWVLCQQVYSKAEIDRALAIIEDFETSGKWESAPYYTDSITTDIYNVSPELARIVYNDNFLNAMKDIFGERATVLPEPSIHKGRYFSWHKDCSFIDVQGDVYQWEADFHATMTVMYFQDNSPEYGGGITCIPRTQKTPDFYHTVENMNIAQRAMLKAKKMMGISHYNKMDNHPDKYVLPSKKGDVIVIDLRLEHQGTQPTHDLKNKPYKTKYGIMNVACKHPHHADKLRVSLRDRPTGVYYHYLKNVKDLSPEVKKIAQESQTRFII